jgi:hypothetical protein
MRRVLLLTIVVVAGLGAGMTLTRQRVEVLPGRLWEPGQMLVVVMPQAEALELVPGAPQAFGAYPPSRETADFFGEISAGAPRRRVGSGPRGRFGRLFDALAAGRMRVAFREERGASPELANLARLTFTERYRLTPPPPMDEATRASSNLLVVTAATSDQVEALQAWSERPAALILGVAYKAPVRVLAAGAEGGLLGDGIARRPGIATPYDVAATVLAQFDLRGSSEDFVGRPLRVVRGAGGAGREGGGDEIEATERRLERDATYEQSLTAYTVAVGIGLGGLVPLFLGLAGRKKLALRIAGGGATASAGYLVAQFIPSPRGDVRALAVAAAFVIGIVVSRRFDPVRWTAGVFALVAFATTVLAVWSALRPGSEPALSFWGNPLVSWRFYGLRNFQVAFLAAGAVVAAAALGARPIMLMAAGGVAAFIAGSPAVGANYVGVLTIVFGAALAAFATMRGAFRWRDAVAATVTAGASFVGALAADAGSVTSHGGRAAERISEGGASALARVVGDRLAVNGDKIVSMPGGPLWLLLIAGLTIGLLVWGLRARGSNAGVRAAVGAGAAMTLAVMALEDSGLGAGTITAYGPMAVWIAAVVPRLKTNPASQPGE